MGSRIESRSNGARSASADKLLTVARHILERDGPDLSWRAVAREAGVSQAAPYYHFKDKHSLLSAVIVGGLDELTADMRAASQKSALPRKSLSGIGLCYVEFALQNRSLFRLMHAPAFDPGVSSEELNAARWRMADILVETVKACLPDATERQIGFACAGAWSLVHGLAVLAIDGRLGVWIVQEDMNAIGEIITDRLAIERYLDI